MPETNQNTNKLSEESSPYLLQHAHNPVAWFPWGKEAFAKAKAEDKPIFLSIGYSTCHWCHVMARECFEDAEVAEVLNQYFVAIKVDKEERPDIDSIYMRVCQALTGSGGWPMSVFITPEQKPFFAGTYFPRQAFLRLLEQIKKTWQTDREKIILSGTEITRVCGESASEKGNVSDSLIKKALEQFEDAFDKAYGGFGYAPKFPMPHNLLFLMNQYRRDREYLEMAEYTLLRMYMGGLYDHIGGGFSRYSTDQYFLTPHFEKMLYDNALLVIAYIRAYEITEKELYKKVAEQTAVYILREMTGKEGGFFSAQDADSDGEEGKYYLFDSEEITGLLGGENGALFNEYYGISKEGNFEGKNILNLLHNTIFTDKFERFLPILYQYRKSRTRLHLDDKILTAWNGLMIGAFAMLYKVLGKIEYLSAAEIACAFIDQFLSDSDTLYASFRQGKKGSKGFLDDYAFYIFGLILLYEASFKPEYLHRASTLCKKAVQDFYDRENGGFYLYGKENEQLILKPKETYDGAMPSGNAVMTYNLVLLSQLEAGEVFEEIMEQQLGFMAAEAQTSPMAHCFYLLAADMYLNPPMRIICALQDGHVEFPAEAIVKMLSGGSLEYPVLNGRTTYYVCKNKSCLPPTNDLASIL